MQRKSRLWEALTENANVFGLAGAAALSAALLNPLPLLVGVVAEAAYLLFVPDSRWYSQRLERRFDAEVRARREKLKADIFPAIVDAMRTRFARLESIREQIDRQSAMDGERWFREVCRKLDYLLEKFLLFARKDAEFRAYLQSVYEEVVTGRPRPVPRSARRAPRYDVTDDEPLYPSGDRWVQATVMAICERYDSDIVRVGREREREEDLNTQAILDKRVEVLAQRRDQMLRLGKILTNLGHQMELLEDSFGLINDQLRARPPEQVLADIEGVVSQTDDMTRLLEELAPYAELDQRLSA
jgi:hypothetical protein